MKIISSEKIPIKMWLNDIEEGTLEQAKNLANLPFAFRHIAIMPDAHQGYGMPIGGVLATTDIIVPNAVGVDIGCGMCAVKTSIFIDQLDRNILKEMMGSIRKIIPTGFNHHNKPQDEKYMPVVEEWVHPIAFEEYDSARHQIGTLGGGNHFIELQKDSDGIVWIMIHSGSRNIGYKVAKHYNEIAYNLNIKWFSNTFLPKNKEDSLAFLPIDSDYGRLYRNDMKYCLVFALANRQLMMDRIQEIISGYFSCSFEPSINIAHNYAQMENHYGSNVMVHRKGATLAREDTIGIIPGSQGSKSYIVKGKGNRESFESCSHGAGRKMGRKQAEKTLSLQDEIKKLNDQGIIHGIRTVKDLDEATGAYKDISEVMKNQEDLVEILVELTPLAVIKGN